jgi:hypothetical protein
MSLTQTQIIRQYEKEIGANRDDVLNSLTRLEDFVDEENIAFSDYMQLAAKSSGRWKFDDINHTDYPEITTNLVAGQRDYTFYTDENDSIILDIYKVYAKVNGQYVELKPVDPDSQENLTTLYNGVGTQGTIYQYDKTANSIRLDLVPSSNVTDGLKVSINREATFFTTDDTTKKPGVPGGHHKWFYLKPALDYARRNTLNSYNRLEAEVAQLTSVIISDFNRRGKDEKRRLTVRQESNK